MAQAIHIESQSIAEDLYALIKKLESSKWTEDIEMIREKFIELSNRLKHALESLESLEGSWKQALEERLQSISQVMKDAIPSSDESAENLKREWRAFRKKLVPMYESLAANLQMQDIHLPRLRPTNYSRNLFHLSSGIIVLMLIQHLLNPSIQFWVALSFSVWAWSMEFGRRYSKTLNKLLMAAFGPLAHPHEHYRVNSATWYASALFLLSIFSSPLASSLAVIILGACDPFAALIGRKFGKHKIRSGRTLEGTLAFVVAGVAVSMLVMAIYYPALSLGVKLLIAASGAITGALAELYSQRVDDNFTIPLSVALGVTLMLNLLGVAFS